MKQEYIKWIAANFRMTYSEYQRTFSGAVRAERYNKFYMTGVKYNGN